MQVIEPHEAGRVQHLRDAVQHTRLISKIRDNNRRDPGFHSPKVKKLLLEQHGALRDLSSLCADRIWWVCPVRVRGGAL